MRGKRLAVDTLLITGRAGRRFCRSCQHLAQVRGCHSQLRNLCNMVVAKVTETATLTLVRANKSRGGGHWYRTMIMMFTLVAG